MLSCQRLFPAICLATNRQSHNQVGFETAVAHERKAIVIFQLNSKPSAIIQTSTKVVECSENKASYHVGDLQRELLS